MLGQHLDVRNNMWKNKKCLITGAAFIGSHLIEVLLQRGAKIRAVNLTKKNLKYIDTKNVEFHARDLRDLSEAKKSVKGMEIVFHLAADHGGRGYVDLNQGNTSTNFLLDGSVLFACLQEGVEKMVFASSGCVYPNYLQVDPNKKLYLKEEMVKRPHDADNMYGWAKLMGEATLKSYHQDFGLKSVSCRYFTVYGERGLESHAIIAMIAKAFIGQDPFEVWGTGLQIRNWTHVSDIVEGTILAAEKIKDATSINLGTTERIRVDNAVKEILKYTNKNPEIVTLPKKPTGPMNRVADNSLAKNLLGWSPKVKFYDGLHKTIDWYFATKDKDEIKRDISKLLEG